MANINYQYQNPTRTYTIDQYIACQSDTVFCYHNLSFKDISGNIVYDTYNVVSDYLDEIRDECVTVQLTEKQMYKYKYRPKLLCYDVYGNSELAFLIMLINDMINVKDFTKYTLLLPTKDAMTTMTNRIYNSNKNDIEKYNLNSVSTLN